MSLLPMWDITRAMLSTRSYVATLGPINCLTKRPLDDVVYLE